MINFQDTDNISLTLTEWELDNVKNIILEPTKYRFFNAHLLRLCQYASEKQLRQLAHIYPDVVAAFLIYWVTKIPEAYKDIIPLWEVYEKMMTPRIHQRTRSKKNV